MEQGESLTLGRRLWRSAVAVGALVGALGGANAVAHAGEPKPKILETGTKPDAPKPITGDGKRDGGPDVPPCTFKAVGGILITKEMQDNFGDQKVRDYIWRRANDIPGPHTFARLEVGSPKELHERHDQIVQAEKIAADIAHGNLDETVTVNYQQLRPEDIGILVGKKWCQPPPDGGKPPCDGKDNCGPQQPPPACDDHGNCNGGPPKCDDHGNCNGAPPPCNNGDNNCDGPRNDHHDDPAPVPNGPPPPQPWQHNDPPGNGGS